MNRLLLACALLAVVIASVKADCSPGYTQRIAVDKLWSTSHESWLFADHFCTVEGARLANIRNDADSIWINDFFLKNKRYLCGSGTGLDTVSREKFILTEFGVVTENGLGTLAIDNIVNKYTDPYSLAFETIQIMGLTTVPTKATYNGTPIPAGDFNFSSATKVLTLTGLKLSISESHVVVWEP